MSTVYSLLDQDARLWWYHRQLRADGHIKEARRRERESIRGHVDTLRKARASGWLSVGRGGWTLHYAEQGVTGSLQGYGGMKGEIPQCALRLGIPIIDSTSIPDATIHCTVSLPLIALQKDRQDKPPWGGMNYAPLDEVAAAYKTLGATVHNLDVPVCDPKKFRSMTRGESKALSSFERGDQLELFEAMMALQEERR